MLRSLFTRRTGRAFGAVAIGVVSMTGAVAATSTAAWAKAKPKPHITSLSLTTVLPAGGQTETITGTALKATGYTTTVTFGSTAGIVPQTGFSATSVSFTTPVITADPTQAITVVLTKGAATIDSNAVDVTDVGPDLLPPASLIVGTGSATTYDVMGHLGDLFQESPGCDLTSTTVNQYDLQCSNNIGTTQSPDTVNTPGGEAGLPVGDVNPLDDYYANAPATGSGNGRNQVTNSGAEAGDPTDPLIGGPDGIAAFNASFARSSSYSSNSLLNYVGYATDGVSWVSLACIGNSATCANPGPDTSQTAPAGATEHWDVTNITKANLQAIWENTLSCTINAATVTMDWRCLQLSEGTKNQAQVTAEPADPIDCYTTQTASGTYGTWQGFLGFTKNVDPPCSGNEAGDLSDSNRQNDHNNLTENQMAVVDSAPDAANAIYFFSYGKFTQTCTANTQVITPAAGQTAQIQGTCIGQNANDVTQFGSISTSANAPIYADAKTIQGNGDQTGVTFLDPRVLYNAYPNSTDTANKANGATLNFIGSTGFLCRPDMATETDPNTGISYRTEIESAIVGDGFFPLDVNQVPFTQTVLANVPSGEVGAGTAYPAAVIPSSGPNSGKGYCFNKN